MRVIDLIEDIEATSRRLHLRGAYADHDIARMTADTLMRPDLTRWLQRSIGPTPADPAERLLAMVARMSEVAHAPAPVCIFGEDLAQPPEPCKLPRRAYARHYHLGGFGPGGADRLPLTLDALLGGQPEEPELLSAITGDENRLGALVQFAFGAAGAHTTVLLLAPWRMLERFAERWTDREDVAFAGPMLHGGDTPYGCLSAVRQDKRL